MTKKEINMENIVTYKTLRDYVKNITNPELFMSI